MKIVFFIAIVLCVLSVIGSIIGGVWYFRDTLFPQAESPDTDKSTGGGGGGGGGTGPKASTAPSPSTLVTLAGQTFDPTGYTVGEGWIWNREFIGAPPGNNGQWCENCKVSTSSIEECRQKCINNPECVHFGRREATGDCFLFKPYPNTEQDKHVRGFKNDGVNPYTKVGNIAGIGSESLDSLWTNPPKKDYTIQTCKQECTQNTSCQAFVYRTDKVADPNYRKTCAQYPFTSAPVAATEKYRDGAVGK